MSNNTIEFYKQKDNDESDDQLNDEELVLQLLKFSTVPLLCMTEDIQKDEKILNFTEQLLKATVCQSHGMLLVFVINR